MKIVHFIFSFQTGGAETMLIDLVNEQVKSEQVYLIILNDQTNKNLISSVSGKVNLLFINRPEGSINPWFFVKLNYLLWRLNPDVVHCHSHNAVKMLLQKSITVFTAHTTGIPVANLNHYKKIFAISQSVKDEIINRDKNLKITVIHNGINTDKIELKEDYSFGQFRIVQIGRLDHTIKGQHILLKALQILIYKKGFEKVSVDLIGEDLIGEGNEYNYLKKLTIDFNIERYVNFLGLKDRNYIYSHLKNYNLLVQPSLIEGFGLTIAEALAAKVPVLVSNIDAPMEVIENGKFGTFFISENPEDCAEKILNIILNYIKLKNQTELAYNNCISNFSIQSTSKRYLLSYS